MTLENTSNIFYNILYKKSNIIKHIQKITYILLYVLKGHSKDRIKYVLINSLLHHIDLVSQKNNLIKNELFQNIHIQKDDSILLNFAHTIEKDSLKLLNGDKTSFNIYSARILERYGQVLDDKDFIEKIVKDDFELELKFYMNNILIGPDIIKFCCKIIIYSMNLVSKSTVIHSITTEHIAEQLARLLNLNNESINRVKFAAAVHDIGKVCIPINILEKNGELSTYEFEIMKSHSYLSYKILTDLSLLEVRDIALMHHEKLDGSGYPLGLLGDSIPFESRIITISDIVSALLCPRSYKNSYTKKRIIHILTLLKHDGKLDEYITDIFITNYDQIISRAFNNCRYLLENLDTRCKVEY